MQKSIELVWIVVSDLKKARNFFTEQVGLRESKVSEEHGWAELCGQDGGTMLGIAQQSAACDIAAGSNAIVTITVDNIEETVAEFKKQNVHLIGDIIEIPGHVKMQMFSDNDGNKFQVCQVLY
jgi:predicted enzyme related to lactoylglutathione lyase